MIFLLINFVYLEAQSHFPSKQNELAPTVVGACVASRIITCLCRGSSADHQLLIKLDFQHCSLEASTFVGTSAGEEEEEESRQRCRHRADRAPEKKSRGNDTGTESIERRRRVEATPQAPSRSSAGEEEESRQQQSTSRRRRCSCYESPLRATVREDSLTQRRSKAPILLVITVVWHHECEQSNCQ
jgi:hypothetical protein